MTKSLIIACVSLVGCFDSDEGGLAQVTRIDVLIGDGRGSVFLSGCSHLDDSLHATLNERPIQRPNHSVDCDPATIGFEAPADAPASSTLVLEDPTDRVEIPLGDALQHRSVTRIPDLPWTVSPGDKVTVAWSHPHDLVAQIVVFPDDSRDSFESRADLATGQLEFTIGQLAPGPHTIHLASAFADRFPGCRGLHCRVTTGFRVDVEVMVPAQSSQ